LKPEEAEKRKKWWGSETLPLGGEGEKELYHLFMKVPRQCPLALLVELVHMNEINFCI
jgi:hypothetical protein